MKISNQTIDTLAIIGGLALVVVVLLEKKKPSSSSAKTTGDFSRMDRVQDAQQAYRAQLAAELGGAGDFWV
jgi:hypothetical protein